MSVRWLHSQRAVMASFVVALLAVGLLTMLVVRQQAAPPDSQVYLESGGSVGANPFVPLPRGTQDLVAGSNKNDGKIDPPGAATTVAESRNTCDSGKLISYLAAHSQAAVAWVKALNSDPTVSWSGGNKVEVQQVSPYIHELTPRLLDGDLRVTNYQFVDGEARPVQSILQKGTTVLVDAKGVARVRCACGNPLTPMVRLNAVPVYRGVPWSGFHPHNVIVTQSGPRCGSDEFSDGARCWQLAACPSSELRGDDGRCYAPPARCSGRQVRADDGWCYYPREGPPPDRDGWRDQTRRWQDQHRHEPRHPHATSHPPDTRHPDANPRRDQPKEPERPEKSGQPEGTESSTMPAEPAQPAQPNKPAQPEAPTRSAKSGQPEGTDESAKPSQQDRTGSPARPGNPGLPGSPGRRDQPDRSQPTQAGKSGQPDRPHVPASTSSPADGYQRPNDSEQPHEIKPPSKPERDHESSLRNRNSGQSDESPGPTRHGQPGVTQQPDKPQKPDHSGQEKP